jgi:hypothetical protein
MTGSQRLPDFADTPEVSESLSWVEAEANQVGGPPPLEELLDISFWPVLSHYTPADVHSPGMLSVERSKGYSVLLELKYSVLSRDIKDCRPVVLRCNLAFTLCTDEGGLKRIPVSPAIVAAWPKPGSKPGVEVTRGLDANGRLTCEQGPVKGELSLKRSHTEKYERYETAELPFIGEPGSPRLVKWSVRAGTPEAAIEGHQYAGFWISHDSPCFVLLAADVEAQAEVRAGMLRRKYEARRRLPLKLATFALQKDLGDGISD